VAALTSAAASPRAGASADPGDASGSEVSAAEQLGLSLRGGPGMSTQLSQTVVTSPAGDELFGFDRDAGLLTGGRCHTSGGNGYLGFRRPGGKLRLLSRLPALASPPVIGGGREAVVVFTRDCKQPGALPDREPLERLRLFTGALGRRPTAATVLSETAEQLTSTIAASPSGELAVAWLAPHGRVGLGFEPTDLLHIAIGRTSGSMSPPVVLGEHDFVPHVREDFFTHVRLAWTARHELLVAYTVNDLVMVQTWRLDHGFDWPQVLGHVNAGGNIDLAIAVGPGGRTVVAWGTQQDIIEPTSPWRVLATVRTGAGAHFGVTQLLDPGPVSEGPGYRGGRSDVTASIDALGFTTVAWSSEQGASGRTPSGSVRAVVVDPGGHFNPVQELAPDSSGLTLSEASGGGTLLQWEVPFEGQRITLGQAARPPGGESFASARTSTSRLGAIDGARLIDSATGG
jgi:hypothetical protein